MKALMKFFILLIIAMVGYYLFFVKEFVDNNLSNIQKNESQIMLLKEANVSSPLFFNDYSDEEFKDDLALYANVQKTNINILSKKLNKKDPSFLSSLRNKNVDTFEKIIFYNQADKNITYENQLSFEDMSEMNAEDRFEAKRNYNKLLGSEKLKYLWILDNKKGFNINPAGSLISNDIIKLFDERYGLQNSLISALIITEKGKEYLDSKKQEAAKKIEIAYKNQDYKKLRMYFKQFREYTHYMNGFHFEKYDLNTYSNENKKNFRKFNAEIAGIIVHYKALLESYRFNGSIKRIDYVNLKEQLK